MPLYPLQRYPRFDRQGFKILLIFPKVYRFYHICTSSRDSVSFRVYPIHVDLSIGDMSYFGFTPVLPSVLDTSVCHSVYSLKWLSITPNISVLPCFQFWIFPLLSPISHPEIITYGDILKIDVVDSLLYHSPFLWRTYLNLEFELIGKKWLLFYHRRSNFVSLSPSRIAFSSWLLPIGFFFCRFSGTKLIL